MQEKPHYAYLDFFRGFAAILVFVGHIRGLFFQPPPSPESTNLMVSAFYFFTSFGHSAVIIFFVLSGCVICNSIESAYSQNRWSWLDYLINRLSRLWVVLLPALLIGGILDIFGSTIFKISRAYNGELPTFPSLAQISYNINISTFIGNAFFVQNMLVTTFGSNGPLWSLANEFWYYIIFPLLMFSFRGNSSRICKLILFVTACVLLYVLGDMIRAYFIVWLFGAGSFYLFRYKRISKQRLVMSMFIMGIILISIVLILIKKGIMTDITQDYLLGAVFSFIIYWAMQIKLIKSEPFIALLSNAIAKPSYSLYVLHFPLLVFLSGMLIGTSNSWELSLKTFLYFLIIFAVVILYTYLIYRLTEDRTSKVRNWLKVKFIGYI